jgi:hypothetical protein
MIKTPRTIEIWFTYYAGKLYLNAERGRSAQWVQNILCHAQVSVRLGACEFVGQARVLTAPADETLWRTVAERSRSKYGWGEGLPVEITPL